MGSIQKKRPCALGTLCSRYPKLGEPMLASTKNNQDGRCNECKKHGLKPDTRLKEHEELFRAVRALWTEGVAEEDIIIPTLVFAAQSQEKPILRALRDQFAEVEESSQAWLDQRDKWMQAVSIMGPVTVKHDTLFLRARPLAVLAFGPDITTIEYMIIDVYGQPKHPVAPEDVEREYERALSRFTIPHDPKVAGFDEVWYADYLRIMVSPPRPQIFDPGNDEAPDRWIGQPPFPPPSRLREHYAGILSHAKESGLANILARKQSGQNDKPHNLMPACVAWYLAGYNASPEQADLSDKDTRLITAFFKALPNPPRSKLGTTYRRDLERVSERISRIDDLLRNGIRYDKVVQVFS